MEYIDLQIYLGKGNMLEKRDYIYMHTIAGYPLRGQFDTENLFFISDINNKTIDAVGVTTGIETKLDLKNMINNWWVLPIPTIIKNSLY